MSAKEHQTIEFINEKGYDIMFIDCVPSKWVIYDKKARSCVIKFMPPLYIKKRKAKLYNLVATKFDALEHWPCYPVYLRGKAGKIQIILIWVWLISFYFK